MALFGKQLTISGDGLAVLQDAGASRNAGRGAINLDNILKLIPGDVVSLYLTGVGLVGSQQMLPAASWPAACFWVCFVVCVLLRIVASKPVGSSRLNGVNWGLVIVTAVAFFVWAHAISDTGPVVSGFHGSVAGLVAMIVGLFSPLAAKQT